ncbi:esterase-like activity of phytase family protein [Arboricoccus pini]|uniref:esterase-like activity of phytase family protein n=1 Tax=Arboricoccus pini TaxID=1963835 RepID=UPI0013FDFEFE|nr:esterase-like activity of phytase family protein [Arboricoccus pini]
MSVLLTAAANADPVRLDFLGSVEMPKGLRVGDTVVGGLSALSYDASSGMFQAVSDDRGDDPTRGPARLYSLRATLAERGGLESVSIVSVSPLKDETGQPFKPGTVDAEGMARLPGDQGLVITSEGDLERGVLPFIGIFDRGLQLKRRLPLPPGFAPSPDGQRGARDNLIFEGASLLPGSMRLAISLENALRQDGPQTSVTDESPSRISLYDLPSGRLVAQYVYTVGRIPVVPPDPGRPGDNGIADILALDSTHLLVIERGYTPGVGNSIRLYAADLDGASNVLDLGSLKNETYRPMRKTLLLDMARLGVRLDNVEGITFGPKLGDGRRTLLLVSDDNFNPSQRTIFYALAIETAAP